MTDQDYLNDLHRRRADLQSRAIEQQQLLAGTMEELHVISRAIKAQTKRLIPVCVSRISRAGSEGGRARMQMMTPEERSEQGRRGAAARAAKRMARDRPQPSM